MPRWPTPPPTSTAARVHQVRSRLHLFGSRYVPALEAGLEALRLLGVDFPHDAARRDAMLADDRAALDAAVSGRSPTELLDLPVSQDPGHARVVELLVDAALASRNGRPDVFPALVVKAVLRSVVHGHAPDSCRAYALFPRLLRAEGQLEQAYRFSHMSLQLGQRMGATALRGALVFAHTASSYFLVQPYASGLPLLRDGFDAAFQAGTLYDASGCALVAAEYLLECSSSLDEIVQLAQACAPRLREANGGLWQSMLRSWVQFVRLLQGRTAGPGSFDGDGFCERDYLAALDRSGAVALRTIFLVLRQVAACLAGDHPRSLELAAQAAQALRPLVGMAIELTHRHYRALSAAALCVGAQPPAEQVALVEAECQALQRLAAGCPANFHHRAQLMAAELARLQGHDDRADGLYAEAIEAAHRSGFVAHKAQAFERAGAFHAERGRQRVAQAFFREARDTYRQWGADVAADRLEAEHPSLAAPPGDASLDALVVARATQALSGVLELDALIDTLMKLALDHAGAQMALLYLADRDTLQPAASARVEGAGVKVRLHRPGAGFDGPQPTAVVNFVRRTHEHVLLADASASHPFLDDAYLRQQQPRQVMCLPLLRMATLVGVLYLEHGLDTGSFTRGRLELLRTLAAQAAISLETARLYAALNQENAERLRAQQSAQERQSRLQRLVESSLVGVTFADAQGRIFDANQAFLQIVGCTRDDLGAGGLTWDTLLPPGQREAAARAADQMRREGRHPPYETEYLRKDGSPVPVLVGGVLFDGEPTQTVSFVLDLSERRRAESDRQARAAAEAASQAKSAFLASMSHELRTPLNGVLGYAQLLRMDTNLTAAQQRAVATIESSGRHLLALINDILDLARIEADRVEVTLEPVDVRQLLDAAADMVRPTAQRKGLVFTVTTQGPVPAAVRADQRRLSQVLINLLGNAVKFTDAGSVRLTAAFEPLPQGLVRMTLAVADTGVGMTEAELQRIFQPFGQVGSMRRRAEGTGLGLAITDALVRRMGGQLTVQSQPGHGSVFTARFDVEAVAAAPCRVPLQAAGGYQGPRRSVLVADDDPVSRGLLVGLLQSLGFIVHEAADGLQAQAAAAALRPDLVLMDCNMPNQTGIQALRALRADPALAGLPVVLVSAGVSDADRRQGQEAGMVAFVPKPVDVGQLVTIIGEQLGLHWLPGAPLERV
jgi:PAS domain S-box-containing protein